MALSAPRDTWMRERDLLVIPVAANAVLHQGGLGAVNATGFAVPGATAATLKAAGRIEQSVDNTGGADGDETVLIRRGAFRFKNSSTDPVTQAGLLGNCYIVDDETVAATNGTNTRSLAGKVLEIATSGVWVEIF